MSFSTEDDNDGAAVAGAVVCGGVGGAPGTTDATGTLSAAVVGGAAGWAGCTLPTLNAIALLLTDWGIALS